MKKEIATGTKQKDSANSRVVVVCATLDPGLSSTRRPG